MYYYRNYSAFAGTQGAVFLDNTSTTTTTGTLSVPVHLYDLTACPNVINNVKVDPAIGWFPKFSNPTDTGTLSWTTGATMQVENITGANSIVDNYPGANDTLDWVSARMLFYAPTQRASRIQVDVVQIKDTRLVPDATTGVSQFATAFWQAMAKRYAYNPLEQGDSRYQKYLKVLDSKTFIMESKESTEAVNTHMKELNLFYRLNRRCTYNWEDQDKMAMLSQEGQYNNDTNMKTQVHPRARIFLMIRAQAGNSTAQTTTLHPTYDIVIRTKHSQMSS